jgi:hypothetical protein
MILSLWRLTFEADEEWVQADILREEGCLGVGREGGENGYSGSRVSLLLHVMPRLACLHFYSFILLDICYALQHRKKEHFPNWAR